MMGHNLKQGRMDILGHSFGIATHVEVGPTFEPLPKFRSLLLHSVLDVNLFRLISREGRRKLVQMTSFLGCGEFVAVKEVTLGMLIAKKEPVPPRVSVLSAVLEKGTERGDSCSRSDHDDVLVRRRKVKVACGLNIDRHLGLIR